MACKVICITNQKGGVGKTSTTEAIASCLKKKGYRVLCIDLDPQGNLSFCVNAETEDFPTIYDVIKGDTKTLHAIQRTESFEIIAANILLSSADIEYTDKDREFILKKRLEPAIRKYDFILLDTPPALGFLTINAFVAADSIVVPMLADIFSLQGIAELNETIARVKKKYNPGLKIAGILINKCNSRSILAKEIMATAELVAKSLNTKVFETKIRVGGIISEAQAKQLPLMQYAKNTNIMKDYMKFVDELLEGNEN